MDRTYTFVDTKVCAMCQTSSSGAKVLGLRLSQSQGWRPKSKTGVATSVCRCRNCGLIFPNPLSYPKSLSDHYGAPPEDYWHSHYFNEEPEYFLRQIALAKQHLEFVEGMSALDVGVGIGKASIALTREGFDVWGIEPSEPFRDRALKNTGLSPERIKLASIEEADFASERFDFITFGAVLEHLYDPSAAIKSALGWLKPRGVIHIEVPSSDWLMSKIINLYFRVCGTNYVTNISPMHRPFHIYEYTLKSFEKNAVINDYEVADFYYEVESIFHLPKFLHPALKFYMGKTNTGMQLTVFLKKRN